MSKKYLISDASLTKIFTSEIKTVLFCYHFTLLKSIFCRRARYFIFKKNCSLIHGFSLQR